MESLLPFQREREAELWSRLLREQPQLRRHAQRAEAALAAGLSPVRVLAFEVDPLAYARALAAWRAEPPPPLSWHGFEVGVELGRGGNGVVYRARWRDQPVALKLLTDREQGPRLVREAALLERLEHPHLVRGVTHGVVDGAPYLATELAEGGSLEEAGVQSLPRALELADQVAAGLLHAHRAGVIHRDLKPSNVLLHGGRARLVDFGLARGLGGTTLTGRGTFLGSADYAAPEQLASAREVGPAADVFGFGGLLCFLCSGRPPWAEARTLGQRLHAIQSGAPCLPVDARAGAPQRPTLEALLALALAADPARRIGLAPLRRALAHCAATL